MQTFIKHLFYSLLFFSLLILNGCSEDPKTAIIGSWEGISLKQDFHFYSVVKQNLLIESMVPIMVHTTSTMTIN